MQVLHAETVFVVTLVVALVRSLRLRLRFFKFLERETSWSETAGASKCLCAFFYAFRKYVFQKFQRTFHDGRIVACDGVSAGQRRVE